MPLHPSVPPFLRTSATQHHLTLRKYTVLTNREKAFSCMDKAGQGETHCVLQLFIGYEEEGEAWKEHEERSAKEGVKACVALEQKGSLKLFSSH